MSAERRGLTYSAGGESVVSERLVHLLGGELFAVDVSRN